MQRLYSFLTLLTAAAVYPLLASAEPNNSANTHGTTQSFSEYAQQGGNALSEQPQENAAPGNTDKIQQQNCSSPECLSQNAASENKDKTWINNLVDKVTSKGSGVIKGVIGTDTPIQAQRRSNASVFDISGIMLRMDMTQVMEAMKKRSYQKVAEHLEIPNFIRWRYEEQCRNEGIVGFERIASCVVIMARKNNYQYVQQMSFSNFHTKETIEVFFTSNFTGNKVYRVMYETEAANIKGSGAKADYLRNLKVFDFWKKINQKYGVPDNKEQVIWGLGENKPSLQAQTGKLVLYDPMLLELDYTRMSREDQKFMNTAVYTF